MGDRTRWDVEVLNPNIFGYNVLSLGELMETQSRNKWQNRNEDLESQYLRKALFFITIPLINIQQPH